MLAVHLKKEFPQLMVQKIISTAEIKEEELIEEGIDFIVSTAKLNLTVPNVYVNSILTETDKKMINAMIKNIDKKKSKNPVKTVKPVKRIGREDIEYMTLLGEEILQVLDNIKISTGENIKNKKQLIEYAGELLQEMKRQQQRYFCIKQTREYRKHIYSEYECIIFTL